jgi:hypothetical protein
MPSHERRPTEDVVIFGNVRYRPAGRLIDASTGGDRICTVPETCSNNRRQRNRPGPALRIYVHYHDEPANDSSERPDPPRLVRSVGWVALAIIAMVALAWGTVCLAHGMYARRVIRLRRSLSQERTVAGQGTKLATSNASTLDRESGAGALWFGTQKAAIPAAPAPRVLTDATLRNVESTSRREDV